MVKTNKCMGIIKTEMRTAVPGNKSKEITVGESDPGCLFFLIVDCSTVGRYIWIFVISFLPQYLHLNKKQMWNQKFG